MFLFIKKQLAETGQILKGFKGNTRACLAVEPMWGVSFNLYAPYASLYMLALGMNDTQVGLVTTVGLALQMIFALVSGHITDRLGRRRTSLIFDIIGWSIPTLVWAFAGGFVYFLIGASINAAFRVVHISWNCLLIEDSPAEQRVHIYTWIFVAGILAGFIAPLAGLFVARFSLVPTVRVLYLLAFIMMTAMFFIRNHFTTETRIGLQKMKETGPFRVKEAFAEHSRVLLQLLKNKRTLVAFFLLVLNHIQIVIKRTFISILLNEGLGFSKAAVSLFPAVDSAVMLTVFVLVMPTLSRRPPRGNVALGLLASALGYGVLALTPGPLFPLAILGTVLSAFGYALVMPTVESLLANAIVDTDRAKTMAILNVFLLGAIAPFGYVGGMLSEISKRLPFALLIFCLLLGIVLTVLLPRTAETK